VSVIADAYLAGVSTRRVEKLVQQLGVERLSKSQVSRLAKSLDSLVEDFRTRPLDAGPYPYVTLDALVDVKHTSGVSTGSQARLANTRSRQDSTPETSIRGRPDSGLVWHLRRRRESPLLHRRRGARVAYSAAAQHWRDNVEAARELERSTAWNKPVRASVRPVSQAELTSTDQGDKIGRRAQTRSSCRRSG
jgi:Transposase, Mutator family